ncbi:hypothetical protein PAMA_017092 [Pampus argenteus]
MLFGFYILLMLRVGRCADDQMIVTKTVDVGDDVTLTCTRNRSQHGATTLFWIRLVDGNLPEFLGGTFGFDRDDVIKTPRITAKQEPGTFVLHINKSKTSDTGLYYCIKVELLQLTFRNVTFLRIKGPEPDITVVSQHFPSDPVRPGDSVTLQCSVLSDSENKRCPEEHRVHWFTSGSDESHPSFVYAHGNTGDECEQSLETRSPHKCFYSFSKKVSSSDAGTYYCAVAACGEIIFGNGTKVELVQTTDSVFIGILILIVCLAISVIGNIFLISNRSLRVCEQYKDAATTDAQQNPHRDEETCIYSTVTFTVMKAGGMKDVKAAERERIYAVIKAFGFN